MGRGIRGRHYQTDVESRYGRIAEVGQLNAPQSTDDAAFIAHARADVPALIAEVERLRALLAAQGRTPTETA